MSCFESSTFLKNPMVMDINLLQKACDQLNWKYQLNRSRNTESLIVTDIGTHIHMYGEFILKVEGNKVTYNRYFLSNGAQLARKLEATFYDVNVAYAKATVVREFEAQGFKLLPDHKFEPTNKIKERFKMVAHSKISAETEKRTEIEFTIHIDGTMVSDSNYIPADVHEKADKAMEGIDQAFGSERKEGEQIQRKKIPLKYKDKAYCKANTNKIKAKY